MIRAAIVVCWILLVLDAVSIGALYRMNPNRAMGYSLATLLPFVFALVAFRAQAKGWTWAALVLNGLLALLGLAILVFAAQVAEPVVAAVAGIVLVASAGVILAGLARRLKAVREGTA